MKCVRWLALAAALTVGLSFCGGDPMSVPMVTAPPPAAPLPVSPPPAPVVTPTVDEACVCTPTDPPSGDYRHTSKHVDLVLGVVQEITVADVLAWTHTAPA